ncbi:MAG: hypothetical protein AAGE80_05405 [Pseudomonadota bacterium]
MTKAKKAPATKSKAPAPKAPPAGTWEFAQHHLGNGKAVARKIWSPGIALKSVTKNKRKIFELAGRKTQHGVEETIQKPDAADLMTEYDIAATDWEVV